MRLTCSSARLAKTPLLVVPVLQGQDPELPDGVEVPPGFLDGFEAKPRALRGTFSAGGPAAQVLLVGLGELEALDAEGLRRAAAVASKRAEELGAAKGALVVPDAVAARGDDPERVGRALAEGLLLGAYKFQDCKSAPQKAKLTAFTLLSADKALAKGVRRGAVTAAANAFTRDLQNLPGNRMTPRELASRAKKIAAGSPRVTCKVLDEKAMAQLGMGLLLGVSQGSTEPARLIHLTYKPKGKAKGKVALVGKGLTFDAGGLSIKPSAKMDEMRYDMSGGAAVVGAFHALAELDLPLEVHGIVGASENTIDGNATKPGDVHTAMNGTTVEVLNTDAEGRLVLADCLCYTAQKVKPDTILDLATLTGAVIVAIGHELSGIFPSSPELRDALVEAGERVGERCWPLPLLQEHRDAMKGQSADLANIGSPAVGAGSSQGAAFLSHFVPEGVDWCHLDIAGTAWNQAARDWVGGTGGTGVGTRLLVEYLEARASSKR